MFEQLKKLFGGPLPQGLNSKGKDETEKQKLQIATCAIFLEMAKSDDDFTQEERREIISIMQGTFELDEKYVDELVQFAEVRLQQSISMYEFTGIINNNFSSDEKFELMKNLWRLIYTDPKLDKYEDHLAKKLGTMLLLEHKDVIAAKLIVKNENV